MNGIQPMAVPVEESAEVHYFALYGGCVFAGYIIGHHFHSFTDIFFQLIRIRQVAVKYFPVGDKRKWRRKRKAQDLYFVPGVLQRVCIQIGECVNIAVFHRK